MMKSKVVAIGRIFFNNPAKVQRMFEKMTNMKIDSTFKRSSAGLMNSGLINHKNKEVLYKYYKEFEDSILNDEYFEIFCFDSIEDFETFDIHGVLKEKSIIIDKMDEEEYGMTIHELSQYCNKSCYTHKKGDHKVVFYDTLTEKEYMVGEFEPRRACIKETDKTVEFSIYPVKTEKVKEIEKVSVSEFVKSKLEECKKNPNWLANEMAISTSSIYGKLDRDSFNAYDLLKIAKLFNLSLEELLERVNPTK